jgi:hypothetical protein
VKLIEMILSQMPEICKPQRKFLLKALQAFLSVSNKLTFSNMSRYIGVCERTFARQFSKAFNFADFNRKAIDLFYGTNKRILAVAFDPFFIPKAGEKTHGKGYFWSGGSGRVEKGLEASLLCVVDLIKRQAYPLAAKQTPNSAEIKKMCEGGPEITRIDWFLSYIISVIPVFPAGIQYLLVDAYFFKEKFVTGICNAGLHVISKMRKDAQLLALYSGPQKARGRRKKFDGSVDFSQLEDVATDDPTITLRSVIAYSVALKCNVLVVMARKQRSDGAIMEALLFSTDTSMVALDVFYYYAARFQIEFVIRDAKQHTGLTHCQSWVKERIDFHINISFAAVNIARIKEYERLATAPENAACSVGSQRVRFHNEMLISAIFSILGLDPVVFKSHPAYEQALSFGSFYV